MTKTPMAEAAIMPPNTAVPTARRLAAPAPTAMTSGSRPRMKAKLVISTGRMRSRAPFTAASSSGTPFSRSSLANSTMRMAFLLARAMSTTMPIWA
jgi:hypothetical protein